MLLLAFFGTGECDPNKDLKQLLALLGFIAGWYIVFRILKRIASSNKSHTLKTVLKSLIVLTAIIASILLLLGAWIGLACGR